MRRAMLEEIRLSPKSHLTLGPYLEQPGEMSPERG